MVKENSVWAYSLNCFDTMSQQKMNIWRSSVSQDEIVRVTDAYKEAEKTPQVT